MFEISLRIFTIPITNQSLAIDPKLKLVETNFE